MLQETEFLDRLRALEAAASEFFGNCEPTDYKNRSAEERDFLAWRFRQIAQRYYSLLAQPLSTEQAGRTKAALADFVQNRTNDSIEKCRSAFTQYLHELASLGLLAKELCHDKAWKIANATAGPSQRSMVVYRYEQIAEDLYSPRGKPLSSDQVKRARDARERFLSVVGLTKAEAKASARFSRAENDAAASEEKRSRAKAKRERLWKKAKERERPLAMQLIAATDASGTFPCTRADRLLVRWNRDKKKLYWKFARTIERFCDEREKGRQLRPTHGPLLEMLCDEWRRNDKALWEFLSACFRTWNDVKNNPESVLRRRTVIHQIAPELGTRGKIQTYLHVIGALLPVKGGKGDVQEAQERRITKDISLGLSKARTKSFGGW